MTKVLGIDFQNVKAYSHKPDKLNYNKVYNIKTGIKWECVEFVRRWYITKFGVTFLEILCAYDIIKIKYVYSIFNNTKYCLFFKTDINNINIGDILIFKKMNFFPCGHVAIVTHLDLMGNIYLSEQNIPWVNFNFSRIIHKSDIHRFGIIGYKTLKK